MTVMLAICRHYVNNLVQYATGVEGITRKATREVGSTSCHDVYSEHGRQSRLRLVLTVHTYVSVPLCVMRRSTLPPRAHLRGRIVWSWWRTTSQMLASGHASRYSLGLWHGVTCLIECSLD